MDRSPGFIGHHLHWSELQPCCHHGIADGGVAAAVWRVLQQRRIDEAGHQAAHLDAFIGPFGLKAFGHRFHARLGRAIDALVGHAIQRGGAGGVDQRAARRGGAQVRIGGLGAVEHAFQVHVDQPVQFLQRDLAQGATGGQAGIVGHHVDPPAGRRGKGGQHRFPVARLRHVQPIGGRHALRQQPLCFRHAGGVQVCQPDEPAFGRKANGNGAADAAGPAGDEDGTWHCLSPRRERLGPPIHRARAIVMLNLFQDDELRRGGCPPVSPTPAPCPRRSAPARWTCPAHRPAARPGHPAPWPGSLRRWR